MNRIGRILRSRDFWTLIGTATRLENLLAHTSPRKWDHETARAALADVRAQLEPAARAYHAMRGAR